MIFIMDEKESYCAKVEERLRDLADQMDEMMWKTNNFARKARKRFKRSTELFRENQNAVTEKVRGIRNASEKSWKELTNGLTKAMGELEKGFENAAHEFKQGENASEVDEPAEHSREEA
jgi:cell division GTPase FtsZ